MEQESHHLQNHFLRAIHLHSHDNNNNDEDERAYRSGITATTTSTAASAFTVQQQVQPQTQGKHKRKGHKKKKQHRRSKSNKCSPSSSPSASFIRSPRLHYSLQQGLFALLSPELKLHIFSFCDWRTLLRCESVCKEWYRYTQDRYLCKAQFIAEFPSALDPLIIDHLDVLFVDGTCTWKKLYEGRVLLAQNWTSTISRCQNPRIKYASIDGTDVWSFAGRAKVAKDKKFEESLFLSGIPRSFPLEEIRHLYEVKGNIPVSRVVRIPDENMQGIRSKVPSLLQDLVAVTFTTEAGYHKAYNSRIRLRHKNTTITPTLVPITKPTIVNKLLGITSPKKRLKLLWCYAWTALNFCSNSFGLPLWKEMARRKLFHTRNILWTFDACHYIRISCGIDTKEYLITFLKNYPKLKSLAEEALAQHRPKSAGEFLHELGFERAWAIAILDATTSTAPRALRSSDLF
ncbi:hypothetical protein QOT17_006441 [Balamuthia mandrillaris]